MRAAIRCLVVALALVVLAPAVGAHERGGGPRVAKQVVRVRVSTFAFVRGTSPSILGPSSGGEPRRTGPTDDVEHELGTTPWRPARTFSRRFRQMGTFAYHCSIHPQMTARVIVT